VKNIAEKFVLGIIAVFLALAICLMLFKFILWMLHWVIMVVIFVLSVIALLYIIVKLLR